MSNEPIGKDCNGVDLFVGDIVFYNNSVYIVTGREEIEHRMLVGDITFPVSKSMYIKGKQLLSTKFKVIKKPKEVNMLEYHIIKATKQDVIDSFKKIYLDWDETMKNIDTAFERTV